MVQPPRAPSLLRNCEDLSVQACTRVEQRRNAPGERLSHREVQRRPTPHKVNTPNVRTRREERLTIRFVITPRREHKWSPAHVVYCVYGCTAL